MQRAVSPRDRGSVTGIPCPRCQHPKTSLLDATSQLALVNYYGCKRCGLVWHRPKSGDGRVSTATIADARTAQEG
jgi:transcription elongation factor Elf1